MKNYITMLRPGDSVNEEDVKRRYRELVKQNHPDLFPEERRREQNLILMEINEAYLSIIGSGEDDVNNGVQAKASSGNVPVMHRDPAYVYYRSAIDHLNRGNYIFTCSS